VTVDLRGAAAAVTRSLQRRIPPSVVSVGAGCVIGAALTMAVTLSERWTVVILAGAGLLMFLPSLALRQAQLYGLTLYLGLQIFEGYRALVVTKYFVDASGIIDRLGGPPSANIDVNIQPSDVVLAALVTQWGLAVLTRHESFSFPRVGYWALAYFGWAIVTSLLVAKHFYLSFIDLVQLAKYLVIFTYVANTVRTMRLVRSIMLILVMCLLLEGSVTLISHRFSAVEDVLATVLRLKPTSEQREELWVVGGSFDLLRAAGTLGQPVTTAMYLGLITPLALSLFLLNRGKVSRWLYFGVLAVSASGVYVTYSRMGLLGLLGGAALCVGLATWNRLIRGRELVVGGYAVVVLLVLMGPSLVTAVSSYFTTRPESVDARFPLLEKGAIMILTHPLFGVGIANHTAAKRELFTAPAIESVYPVHNHYVIVASETGVLGFVLYFTFFGLIGRKCLQFIRSSDIDTSSVGLGVLSAYGGLGLFLFGDHFAGNSVNSLVWFYAGLIVACSRMRGPRPLPSNAGPPGRLLNLANQSDRKVDGFTRATSGTQLGEFH